MKTVFWISTVCVLMMNMSSCTQDNNNEIETELQVHFDNFVEAAATNGMNISIEELDIGGYIENIQVRGTLGQCKSYSNGSKQVVIDQPYWDRADEMEREYLVFHELGHCILDRDHLDSKDANGNCTSIMQSGDNSCKGSYNIENRSALLNELF